MSDKLIGLGFVTVWGFIAIGFTLWRILHTLGTPPPTDRREDLPARQMRWLGPWNWVLFAALVGFWVFAFVMIATNT